MKKETIYSPIAYYANQLFFFFRSFFPSFSHVSPIVKLGHSKNWVWYPRTRSQASSISEPESDMEHVNSQWFTKTHATGPSRAVASLLLGVLFLHGHTLCDWYIKLYHQMYDCKRSTTLNWKCYASKRKLADAEVQNLKRNFLISQHDNHTDVLIQQQHRR